ncbi:MAG: hypothetical protein JXB45_09235, partial [Candidatus Krumholzibacteriota bacterium]|nr:hypothetical protein [Candidatus Krumholzibacteriota bacterium]
MFKEPYPESRARKVPGGASPREVFFLLFLAFLAALAGCGQDPADRSIPSIYAIRPDSAGVGDTVIIWGDGFHSSPALNTINFSPCGFSNLYSGRKAVPFAGSETELSVVVPDGAFIGRVRAEWPCPLTITIPLGVDVPPLPSNALSFKTHLRPGEAAKVFYSGSDYTFTVEPEPGGEEYLLILFGSGDPPYPGKKYSYRVNTDTPCPGGEGYSSGPSGEGRGRTDPLLLSLYGEGTRDLERRIWRELIEILAAGKRDRGRNADIGGDTPPSRAFLAAPAAADFQ